MRSIRSVAIAKQTIRFNGKPVRIVLHKPVRVRAGGYVCKFETMGLPRAHPNYAVGIDSMQAFYRAMGQLVSHLSNCGAYAVKSTAVGGCHSFPPFLLTTEFFDNSHHILLRSTISNQRRKSARSRVASLPKE